MKSILGENGGIYVEATVIWIAAMNFCPVPSAPWVPTDLARAKGQGSRGPGRRQGKQCVQQGLGGRQVRLSMKQGRRLAGREVKTGNSRIWDATQVRWLVQKKARSPLVSPTSLLLNKGF